MLVQSTNEVNYLWVGEMTYDQMVNAGQVETSKLNEETAVNTAVMAEWHAVSPKYHKMPIRWHYDALAILKAENEGFTLMKLNAKERQELFHVMQHVGHAILQQMNGGEQK